MVLFLGVTSGDENISPCIKALGSSTKGDILST